MSKESLYIQAARFANKEKAGAVYFSLQNLIWNEISNCDLSVYRVSITEGWFVAVVGETPFEKLHERIEALLSRGTLVNLVSLRPDVVAYLQSRRDEMSQLGPWIEIHREE